MDDIKVGKGFATNVFKRLPELGLKSLIDAKVSIRTAEDYALEMLRAQDVGSKAFFKDLLQWQLGKPVQPSIQADTREFAPPLSRGDTPSYFERTRNAARSHKPN